MVLMVTFCLLFSLIFSSSPLKLSLTLAGISTLMGTYLYQLTNSVFIPSVLIISFSSGMMILFSYCSMLSNYEAKSNLKPNLIIIFLIMTTAMINSTPMTMENLMKKMVLECSQTTLLAFLMVLVIVTMICMNTSFFNPTKKFMQSY